MHIQKINAFETRQERVMVFVSLMCLLCKRPVQTPTELLQKGGKTAAE